MHKTFGTRLPGSYYERRGAYLIPLDGGRIAVVRTPKGLFFLGGGIEAGETDEACIRRECLEEAGFTVRIDGLVASADTYAEHSSVGHFHPIQTYYAGALLERVQAPIEQDHTLLWLPYEELRGKMFSEMQNWALDLLWNDAKK